MYFQTMNIQNKTTRFIFNILAFLICLLIQQFPNTPFLVNANFVLYLAMATFKWGTDSPKPLCASQCGCVKKRLWMIIDHYLLQLALTYIDWRKMKNVPHGLIIIEQCFTNDHCFLLNNLGMRYVLFCSYCSDSL